MKSDKIEDLQYSQAGRTDKKVSSSGNVISLKIRVREIDEKNLVRRINSALPDDIVFLAYSKVDEGFSARHMPVYREYHYYFFSENYDVQVMERASKLFEGSHDFRNFCKMKPEYEERGTVREIFFCEVKRAENLWSEYLPVHVFVC